MKQLHKRKCGEFFLSLSLDTQTNRAPNVLILRSSGDAEHNVDDRQPGATAEGLMVGWQGWDVGKGVPKGDRPSPQKKVIFSLIVTCFG